ncbi:hypothetical protein NDI37_11775 [Funiculus sociatus GB2-A5]|uniref:MHC class I antigen n=1 Tax=Funiculus sociatus GB2-A5 TaxID=2933946 RepID=A0ABV0JNY5_9CYAN|nr:MULTISPECIES: hypothetical protein [unclassified Trichocoleus]MBD1908217.1 hypothetical protein [Trichocoleus sp. FACHB-832]MBD2061773.1 hypothetical protein [Trichocoleus sp. FACHB-6]
MKTSAALFTLNRIWQGFLRFLVNASELRVWQVSDGHGHTYWRAYDPVSGRSSYLGSEAEVRSWIEQRYYNR